jgi:hypothetical protein
MKRVSGDASASGTVFGKFSAEAQASWDNLNSYVSSSQSKKYSSSEKKVVYQDGELQIIRKVITKINVGGEMIKSEEEELVNTKDKNNRYTDAELSELAITHMNGIYSKNSGLSGATYTECSQIKDTKRGAVYAICSYSSRHFLDGRSPDLEQVHLTNRNPKGDVYLNWTFEEVDGNFAIKSVSSQKYLDGRTSKQANTDGVVFVTNRNPKGDTYLQWKLEPVDGEKFAIKSVSSGLYLNGRNSQYVGNKIWLSNGNPHNDGHFQWTKEKIY